MSLNAKDGAHFLSVSIVILLLALVVGMSAVACVGCWLWRKKWNQVIKRPPHFLIGLQTSAKKSVVQKVYFPDAMEGESEGFCEEMFTQS